MKIEAITVCVNYSDFLAASLPVNRRQFDRLIVVTDSKDEATKDACRAQKVLFLELLNLRTNGDGVFSKAITINQGILFLDHGQRMLHDQLESPTWLCILDADVVLPLNFRETIMQCARVGALDPTCIYGIDRLMCRSYEAWTKYIGRLRHPDPRFVTTEDFPIGKRYSHFGRDGWAPMGFFQMWNPRGSGIRQYPEGDAMALCDLKFAQKWPRAKRVLLPEIVAVHLESEACEFGKNWHGRKTPPFVPIREQAAVGAGTEVIVIPHITDHFEHHVGQPGWFQPTQDGQKLKPLIRCNCGVFCGIGLHHVDADGSIRASFWHKKGTNYAIGESEEACGWHVWLKLKDYDGGAFGPKR